jgi:hypothetical protein
MRLKSLVGLLLFIFAVSCLPAKVRITDKKWMRDRLIQRIDEFQTNYLENRPDKVRSFMLSEKNKEEPGDKKSFEEYLKKDSHMSRYYEVKYKIEDVEIKCKKAKVKMTYLVKDRKDSDFMRAGLFDYWVFEGDNWFFAFGGKPEFYEAEGWW